MGKANPLQDDHLRTAVSGMGLTSTRKTLTEWKGNCRGQKDGWGLEHILYKERLGKPGFGKKSLRAKHWSKDPGQLVRSLSMEIFKICRDKQLI